MTLPRQNVACPVSNFYGSYFLLCFVGVICDRCDLAQFMGIVWLQCMTWLSCVGTTYLYFVIMLRMRNYLNHMLLVFL